MRLKKVVLRTFLRHSIDAVYLWHLRKRAFLHGFPSWETWIYQGEEELDSHQLRIRLKLRVAPLIWIPFVLRLQFDKRKQLIRIAIDKSVVRAMHVNVEFRPHSIDATEMIERVEYLLRCPSFFRSWREERFEKRMKAFFHYRHETVEKDLDFFKWYKMEEKRGKVLISGGSGMIGQALSIFLENMGYEVHQLTRRRSQREQTVFFDDCTGEVELDKLEGFDAIVHLRGKNIFCRWTPRRKQELRRSRIDATRKLAHHLALLSKPPKVFLCASAVGYYGDCSERSVTESAEGGQDLFLSELAQEWEEATEMLYGKHIRVVNLRFGMVLSMLGGALRKMVWPIRYGLAGPLGSGEQYQSWIALDDAVHAITHCLLLKEITGGVNITSPHPVTNRELTAQIANHFHKSVGPRIPAPLIRCFAGEMGEELLLTSTRALPQVLDNTGFHFRYPTLQSALKRLLPI